MTRPAFSRLAINSIKQMSNERNRDTREGSSVFRSPAPPVTLPGATGGLKASAHPGPTPKTLPPKNCSLGWSLAESLHLSGITEGLRRRDLMGKAA